MERIIIPKTSADQEAFFNKILDRAFGVPEIFGSAPTSDQLQPNTWGKNGSNIYVKFSDGVMLRISGTII